MKFPDKLDVLTAHARIIGETGGSGGIRDEDLLESALAAVLNRRTYEAADLAACAATYAYHLTQAHAFIDGNKRIAAAVAETFLESNGAQLAMTDGGSCSAVFGYCGWVIDSRRSGANVAGKNSVATKGPKE